MKHYSWMAVSALLLGFMMLNLTSCSKDEEDGVAAQTEKENGGKDDDGNKDIGKEDFKPVVVPDVVVTVDDSGQADGGHNFQKIDYKNFYIDGIKYTIENDHLVASGYDAVKFRDAAVIISTLKYQGRTMDVTSIKEYAFRDCKVMTSCVIGNKVTSIEICAFDGCSGLTSVTIPNSVTSIGYDAFEGCSGMTSVTIPSSVTSIGYRAFDGCSGLTSVHISDIAAWCAIDFSDYYSNPLSCAHHLYLNQKEITNLIIPDGMTSIDGFAFSGCSGLTSVTIPNSVTRIGADAFASCSGLTTVTIPSSVTSIGQYAFSGCSGLTSVIVAANNPKYDSRENCNAIIETATNTLIVGCKNTVIPNSVTSIGIGAFVGCRGLTSVTIPSSVTSIGFAAFSGCSGLTSVTIPESVTSIEVGAFAWCSGLQHFYCHAVNPPSAYDSFLYTPISSATLHVPAESLDAYKATSPWSEFGTIVAL